MYIVWYRELIRNSYYIDWSEVKIRSRYHAAYLGACQHAASEEFERAKIRREDWVAGSVRNMASLWVL